MKKMENNQRELISVIVIICNVEEYLDECLESIKDQSYQNLEVILVDDGSIDQSGSICDKYAKTDKRFKVIHKSNGGLVSARQAGIMEATGRYVAFVDGDDWLDKDMYEILYLLARHYEADAVLSGIVRELPAGARNDRNILASGYYEKTKLISEVYPEMMYSMEKRCCLLDPSLCNKLFVTEAIRTSVLKVDPEIFYLGEDAAATYPCLLTIDSFYVTDICMYHHRIVAEDKSKDKNYKHDKIFERLLLFYNNMQKNLQGSEYANMMLMQLNGYFFHLLNKVVLDTVNLDMFLFFQQLFVSKKVRASSEGNYEYILPDNEIQGYKKIVLYGAGRVGQDYYAQLQRKSNLDVVLWADKKYETLSRSGLPVENIESIKGKKIDIIILAAQKRELAENMKQNLIDKGVDEEYIKWVEPVRGIGCR